MARHEKMIFKSGAEMLDFLQDGNDLYSPSGELYVFCYNDKGSVCSYPIDNEEAESLAKTVRENGGEYWAAFLGVGGSIYDDTSHECYVEGQVTNADYCERLSSLKDWMLTSEL